MVERRKLVPDDSHPITVDRNPAEVVVRANGAVIARATKALALREAGYPPVHYLPRDEVEMHGLRRSEHRTYCPYKGEAAYFDIVALGEKGRNAVWTYEDPFDAVKPIADHLAFYPDRVSITEGSPER